MEALSSISTAAVSWFNLPAMGRLRQALVLAIVTVVSAPALAGAQYNTAELSGVVKDAKGGVLPGANVVALHVASGRRSERLSDSEGRFILPALPVGDYQMFVELSGFKRFEQHGLTLNVGQKIDLLDRSRARSAVRSRHRDG